MRAVIEHRHRATVSRGRRIIIRGESTANSRRTTKLKVAGEEPEGSNVRNPCGVIEEEEGREEEEEGRESRRRRSRKSKFEIQAFEPSANFLRVSRCWQVSRVVGINSIRDLLNFERFQEGRKDTTRLNRKVERMPV